LNSEGFLRRTLALAQESVRDGNHPFGALLVVDGEILLESKNTVTTESDVTRHAELNLVSRAGKIPLEVLRRATLYSSTEPCGMCAGAIYWAGIRHVVFACSAVDLAQIAGGGIGTEFTRLAGPFLGEEAQTIHRNFWTVKSLDSG
jgi:tRNA(Arg) A34 adenosine deaminase TadA